ncbi:hypothetical protein [Streptomyces sp. NPDC018031]|uniref:hypothetical protein n=1 Tax=Streptomyces sp. NPDC018031 TaxID=3365033 RepID=UPI0037BBD65E
MTVRLGIDTDRLQAGAERARRILTAVGKSVAGLGVGVPAVAAVTAGVGALAAGFATAAAGASAFKLAAQPQLQQVAEVAELAADAEKAAAEGAEDAAEKQQEYNEALKRLPPATQATAREFIGLKSDFKAWSDSLSGTTMPVFTKGLQILRDLLPSLSPLVKAAARAISGFLDEIQERVDRGSVTDWAERMAEKTEKNLGSFIRIVRNIVVGFGGLVEAFAGHSTDMTGGLEEMTERFANWGQGLEGSDGFADFLEMSGEGADTMKSLALAAGQLFLAVSPLLGATAALAVFLADIINAVPPDVLAALAITWASVALAVKAYGLYTIIAAAATRGWALAQLLLNGALAISPVGLIIALIVGLAAVIVIAWQKSETFREIVRQVWEAVTGFIQTAVDAIKTAVNWFRELPGKVGGWFGRAKDAAIRAFQQLVSWMSGLPGRAVGALASWGGKMWTSATTAGGRLVAGIKEKLKAAVDWVRGLPQRAKTALGDLSKKLWNSGVALIQGFIDGIVSKAQDLYNKVAGVVGKVRDLWPFSPAKDGPFSGKGWVLYSGRSIGEAMAAGLEQRQHLVQRAAQDMMSTAHDALAMPGMPGTPRGVWRARAEPQRIQLDVTGGSDDLVRVIRRWLQTNGYGSNVQAGFGG